MYIFRSSDELGHGSSTLALRICERPSMVPLYQSVSRCLLTCPSPPRLQHICLGLWALESPQYQRWPSSVLLCVGATVLASLMSNLARSRTALALDVSLDNAGSLALSAHLATICAPLPPSSPFCPSFDPNILPLAR